MIQQTVSRLTPNKQDREDSLQEAFISLQLCANGYDPESKILFISYLIPAIKRRITQTVLMNGLPDHVRRLLWNYRRFKSGYLLSHGREPSDSEIMGSLSITKDELTTIRRAESFTEPLSLDKPTEYQDEGETSLYEAIPDGSDFESAVLSDESSRAILEAIKAELTPQDAEAVIMRANGHTFAEIQKGCGYSTSGKAQRQIFKACSKLRRSTRFMDSLPDGRYYHGSLSGFLTTWTSSTEREAIERL